MGLLFHDNKQLSDTDRGAASLWGKGLILALSTLLHYGNIGTGTSMGMTKKTPSVKHSSVCMNKLNRSILIMP